MFRELPSSPCVPTDYTTTKGRDLLGIEAGLGVRTFLRGTQSKNFG